MSSSTNNHDTHSIDTEMDRSKDALGNTELNANSIYPHQLIDSNSSGSAASSFMTDSLVKYLFLDRIYPLLPVKSDSSTYQEVELNELFLSCRSLILNISVSRDVNITIEKLLDVIEIVEHDANITSETLNTDILQSILVLTRLLSDALEYFWESCETRLDSLRDANNVISYEKQRVYFKSYVVGFSTHRSSFHTSQPKHLRPKLATRLIHTCIKLKNNTGTIKVLKNMTPHLHSNKTTSISHILPEYQNLIKECESPITIEKIDLTIDYILRFVAASNNLEYNMTIRETIMEPLTVKHTVSELTIVEYFELFGCLYLTNKTLSEYLKMLQKISLAMKKTVFHSLLLYYFSKSFLFWVMARPKEYIQLYQNLLHIDNSNTDETIKDIPELVCSLFDDVYNTFNVGEILTCISDHYEDSLVKRNEPQRELLHHHSYTGNINDRSSGDGRDASNSSTKDRARQQNQQSLHNQSPSHLNSKYPNPALSNKNDSFYNTSTGTSSSYPNPYSQNTSSIESAVSLENTKLILPATNISRNSSVTRSNNSDQSSQRARKDKFVEYNYKNDENESIYDTNNIENEFDQKIEYDAKINAYYLENILELYSTFNETELLTNTSVLRFLIGLTFLDINTISEVNNLSFKGLKETADVVEDSEENLVRERRHTLSSSEKEKGQSIRQLAHGLKRIASLPNSNKKSRQTKFLAQILANLTNPQTKNDVVSIDSLRSCISFMTLSSSISLYNENLPCVRLTKRFYNLLGQNLGIGKNWNSTTNKHIIHCKNRYPIISRRLKLEFFAAAVQLDLDNFLKHLMLDEELQDLNLKKLCLYTEGFRVSLHLLNKEATQRRSVRSLSKFLQTLFSINADSLIKAYPYFDPSVTKIVSSILGGPIFSIFDATRSSLIKLNKGVPLSDELKDYSQPMTLSKMDYRCSEWDISGILPKISDSINVTASEPESDKTISTSETLLKTKPENEDENSDKESFHIIMPKSQLGTADSSVSNINPLETLTPSSIDAQTFNTGSQSQRRLNVPSTTPLTQPITSTPVVSPITSYYKAPRLSSSRRTSDERTTKLLNSFRSSYRTSTQDATTNFIPETKESNNEYINRNVEGSLDEISLATANHNDARKIMMNIFSIFKKVSNYFISPNDETLDSIWNSGDFRTVIKPIFVAILDVNQLLQNSAESFMDILILYISEYADLSDPSLFGTHFLLCSYTITLFSSSLFDMRLSNQKREILLKIVIKFLAARALLIKNARRLKIVDQVCHIDKEVGPLMMSSLASALILSLYCNRETMPKLLRTGFFELDQIILFYENTIGPIDKSCVFNVEFIHAMGSGRYTSSGSVAFQRRLKNNIVKYVTQPDVVLLDSLNIIYTRWHYFSSAKYLDQQELSDFRNLAGIVASLSGILFSFGSDTECGFKEFSYILEVREELFEKLKYFIGKQCEWLNYPDLLTRENSRDILSIELHPLAYKVLFNNLNSKIDKLNQTGLIDTGNDYNSILLEQIIIIFRTILKRNDEEHTLLMFSTDLIQATETLINIIESIPNDSVLYFKSIIQISKMFIAIEKSESTMALKNHFLLKNRWIKVVMNWFSLTIVKDYDLKNLAKPHREMNLVKRDSDFLYIDTSIECVKALAYLTKGVPLTTEGSNSVEDFNRSEMITFGNYFSILLKGLEKSTNSECYPVSLKHKINILTDNIIISLTNISNANVDASLQFSLPMGYSPNKNIRIAFLKVLIDIVNNFAQLKEKDEAKKIEMMDKYLLHLIKYPKIAYVGSLICPSNDIDEYAAGLVNAFDTRNASPIVIEELIRDEIAKASRYAEVLRRNSCATRALSIFAKSKGVNYLVKTLRPVLLQLNDNKEWFEIEKLTLESPDTNAQTELFLKYLLLLTNSISNSISYFPLELIHICQTIYNSVKAKFPDYAYISVGSFVFLRFLGPALVTPDSEDILIYCDARSRRSFITLAKVIQSMANGSDGHMKWPVLQPHLDLLNECNKKIFDFLTQLCNYDKPIQIKIRTNDIAIKYDYSYLHKFMYKYDCDLRDEVLKDLHSVDEFKIAKETFSLFDDILGVVGQPAIEIKNEIPKFVKENMDTYPQLYEFMNRHSFRVSQLDGSQNSEYIRESMTNDGLPMLTITFNEMEPEIQEIELVIYRIIQIFARIWTNKYCLVLDCTEFNLPISDFNRICYMIFSLLPNIAVQNCVTIYFINVTKTFMESWILLIERGNPIKIFETPFKFLNSNADLHGIKSLNMTGKNMEVLQNIRVSIHDIKLFNEERQEYYPIKLKIGDKYFQVLHETPATYSLSSSDRSYEVKFNDVFEIVDIDAVHASSSTESTTEFTVTFFNRERLIFTTSKYLEIVKMFYYAQSKLQSEYNIKSEAVATISVKNSSKKEGRERVKTACHLCLIIVVGLFHEDDMVKQASYNLLVAVQDAFDLDFGTKYYYSSELFVPEDTTSFLSIITSSLCTSSPEMTPYIWKYMIEGLENGVIRQESFPTIICCLSSWIPTMYRYVYLMEGEDGPEMVSSIIRSLIRLTVRDTNFSTLYLQQIWYKLSVDGRLTKVIVNEIVNHALERDSEDRDWKKVTVLLTCFPTIEIASEIVKRFIDIIRSFLPSLRLESSTRSWSEVTILSKISVALFFESPLLAQMYLPELLFIISLLIDIGPPDLRLSLHMLLMNICHSLTLNKALSESARGSIQQISKNFLRQKVNLMSGYSPDKGSIITNFNSPSFTSKFGTLEHFITNVIALMECNSQTETAQWKTKYKENLMNSIFTNHSFLSARAMMILGVVGKKNTSEILCRDLLVETMKVFAAPSLTDETLILAVSHSFTYSKIVEGLDPSLHLMRQLFWLSTTILESPYQIQFEGGMLFMINCLDRLYIAHFKDKNTNKCLPQVLMDSRIFGSNLLVDLENLAGVTWSNANFPHILIGFIMRGLSIPVLKGVSMECLKTLFKNSYLDIERDLNTKTFYCYLFTIYLLFNPDQFMLALEESNIFDDMISLDDHNQIPRELAEWLASDHMCSSIALYQGALLFSSNISDDACKLRFALIMRYLLQTNQICLFKFYVVVRRELRRISALEHNTSTTTVAFDIIGMLVTHPEYNKLDKFYHETLAALEHRGLTMISKIDLFDNNMCDMNAVIQGDCYKTLYERKKLLTMILARMTCYI